MIGTVLNVAGIFVGGLAGLRKTSWFSPEREAWLRVVIGAFTVFYGLRLTWRSLNGSALQILGQVVTMILAMILGKLCGRVLRLQKASNRLGRWAKATVASAADLGARRRSEGFKVCTALFCAAPLAVLGAVQDGLSGYFYTLAMKTCLDGLATIGFAAIFGWSVMLSLIPVLALEGTLTTLCFHVVRPWLEAHSLVDPVNAVGGLLVFSVALVMLKLKKIELADYLPSLAFAPLLAWVPRNF